MKIAINTNTIETTTRAILWTQFWYQYNITYTCESYDILSVSNTTCNFDSGIKYWEFSNATQYTRILFGSAWCVVVLACFLALGSVVTGQKKPLWLMIVLALVSVVGFASFFTLCIRSDSAAYGCDNATFGPCNSFVGVEDTTGPFGSTISGNAYWGPSWGLYSTIIAGFWVTVLAIGSCLCSIFCSKPNPRPELQGLLDQPQPVNYAVRPYMPVPPPEQHVIIGANNPVQYLVVDAYNPGSNSKIDYPGVEVL